MPPASVVTLLSNYNTISMNESASVVNPDNSSNVLKLITSKPFMFRSASASNGISPLLTLVLDGAVGIKGYNSSKISVELSTNLAPCLIKE